MLTRRRVTTIVVLSVFLLSILLACQSTNSNITKTDFGKGVSGFTGKVEPFVTPIVLRYKEVPAFSLVMTGIDAANKLGVSVRGHGSVVKVRDSQGGEKFLWVVAFNAGEFEGKQFEIDSPFLSFRASSDECGGIDQLEVSVDKKYAANSQNAIEELKVLGPIFIAPLPKEPVLMGDEIPITGIGKMCEQGYTSFISRKDTPKSISITKNTLRGRVSGVTLVNGQRHLVIRLSGSLNVALADIMTVSVNLQGYSLINTNNGLATATAFEWTYKAKDWTGNTSEAVKSSVNVRLIPM